MEKIHVFHATSIGSRSITGAFNKVTGDSERKYGDGTNSSIGVQFNTEYYDKKALIELAKEQYFGQLADTTSMP